MNPLRQETEIAEACGWTMHSIDHRGGMEWLPPKGWSTPKCPDFSRANPELPDFLNDHNAMRKAINSLSIPQRTQFLHHLDLITLRRSLDWFPARIITATLNEYAEAFLATVGKWEDE